MDESNSSSIITKEPWANNSVPFENDDETERIKELEEEQEQLNQSLRALTTHFAQVQFRLRQIISAPNESKEVI